MPCPCGLQFARHESSSQFRGKSEISKALPKARWPTVCRRGETLANDGDVHPDLDLRQRLSPRPPTSEALFNGGPSPHSKATVFSFDLTSDGEAALLLSLTQGNLLVTCDSVQNWVDTKGCSLMGGLVTRAMGFIQPAKIGPMWLKKMSGNEPSQLRPDFERLLSHDFQHLIAGHGELLRDDAKEALRRSCARVFGD